MKRIWPILLCLLLLAGCNGSSDTPDHDLTTVEVQALTRGALPTELVVPAQIKALSRASVNASTSGIVEQVGPEEGDQVSQGQAVIWLKNPSTRTQINEQTAELESARASQQQAVVNVRIARANQEAQLAQARADLQQAKIAVEQAETEVASAKNEVERKTPLYEEKVIALTELEQARLTWEINKDQLRTAQSKLEASEANLRLARTGTDQIALKEAQLDGAAAEVRRSEAALDAAQRQLQQSILKAPISGVVVSRGVDPGESIQPGQQALLTIVNNQKLEIEAPIDQRYAMGLTPGLQATMTSLIHRNRDWTVALKDTVPSSNSETSTVLARFRFEGTIPDFLVDGTPVQLRLLLGETTGILIPREAVFQASTSGEVVALVNDGVILRRAVKPLAVNETHVLVSGSDFQAGEEVVVKGGVRLSEGQRVTVKKP